MALLPAPVLLLAWGLVAVALPGWQTLRVLQVVGGWRSQDAYVWAVYWVLILCSAIAAGLLDCQYLTLAAILQMLASGVARLGALLATLLCAEEAHLMIVFWLVHPKTRGLHHLCCGFLGELAQPYFTKPSKCASNAGDPAVADQHQEEIHHKGHLQELTLHEALSPSKSLSSERSLPEPECETPGPQHTMHRFEAVTPETADLIVTEDGFSLSKQDSADQTKSADINTDTTLLQFADTGTTLSYSMTALPSELNSCIDADTDIAVEDDSISFDLTVSTAHGEVEEEPSPSYFPISPATMKEPLHAVDLQEDSGCAPSSDLQSTMPKRLDLTDRADELLIDTSLMLSTLGSQQTSGASTAALSSLASTPDQQPQQAVMREEGDEEPLTLLPAHFNLATPDPQHFNLATPDPQLQQAVLREEVEEPLTLLPEQLNLEDREALTLLPEQVALSKQSPLASLPKDLPRPAPALVEEDRLYSLAPEADSATMLPEQLRLLPDQVRISKQNPLAALPKDLPRPVPVVIEEDASSSLAMHNDSAKIIPEQLTLLPDQVRLSKQSPWASLPKDLPRPAMVAVEEDALSSPELQGDSATLLPERLPGIATSFAQDTACSPPLQCIAPANQNLQPAAVLAEAELQLRAGAAASVERRCREELAALRNRAYEEVATNAGQQERQQELAQPSKEASLHLVLRRRTCTATSVSSTSADLENQRLLHDVAPKVSPTEVSLRAKRLNGGKTLKKIQEINSAREARRAALNARHCKATEPQFRNALKECLAHGDSKCTAHIGELLISSPTELSEDEREEVEREENEQKEAEEGEEKDEESEDEDEYGEGEEGQVKEQTMHEAQNIHGNRTLLHAAFLEDDENSEEEVHMKEQTRREVQDADANRTFLEDAPSVDEEEDDEVDQMEEQTTCKVQYADENRTFLPGDFLRDLSENPTPRSSLYAVNESSTPRSVSTDCSSADVGALGRKRAQRPSGGGKTLGKIEEIKAAREARRAALEAKRQGRQRLLQEGVDPDMARFVEMLEEWREINVAPKRECHLLPATVDRKLMVCVRKRPLNERELAAGATTDFVTFQPGGRVVMHEPGRRVDRSLTLQHWPFKFDLAFDDMTSNEEVFASTAQTLVDAAVQDEASSTMFAYGQTGSGKTFSMAGAAGIRALQAGGNHEAGMLGMYQLSALYLFEKIHEMERPVLVTISFIEIYGSKVRDLLDNRREVRLMEDGHGHTKVVGAREAGAATAAELCAHIVRGSQLRVSRRMAQNNESSRSHAVLSVQLYAPGEGGRKNTLGRPCGRFSLVDLAGNERGADNQAASAGSRLESAEINKSLLALKECIRSLARGRPDDHTPFRQSKLTTLLRESFLNPRARVCVLSCVSPGSTTSEYTLNTLRYASMLKQI